MCFVRPYNGCIETATYVSLRKKFNTKVEVGIC